ncbi:MAG: DUF134 domain-containing protein [Patescibacteria group bacterium]|nr:DUF134 domain-containing protein [Patescibacteria group bacterium]
MRRRIRRRLQHTFNDYYFKPRGIPMTALDEVKVTDEELETLRLRFVNDLDQHTASKQMGISQSQYQRDFVKAMEKITKALIEGKAILIERKSKL